MYEVLWAYHMHTQTILLNFFHLNKFLFDNTAQT